MCGIVGYIGSKQAREILVEGLRKLEYRGYDSAGIALCHEGKMEVEKTKGPLSTLEERLQARSLLGQVGIGHTRWATPENLPMKMLILTWTEDNNLPWFTTGLLKTIWS